jgi:hypothetical protein
MPNPTNFNIYKWNDLNAPVLNWQGPSVTTGTTLTNLLDKVLVSGYGTKSAAGWTKPYQDGLYHAYRMGSNSSGRYLQVYASPPEVGKSGQTYAIKTDVFDSMSSATVGIGTIYQKNYANAIGWTLVDTAAGQISGLAGRCQWIAVANSASFYLFKWKYYNNNNYINMVGVADINSGNSNIIKRTILINDMAANSYIAEVFQNYQLDSALTGAIAAGGCWLTKITGNKNPMPGSNNNSLNLRGSHPIVTLQSLGYFSTNYAGGSWGPAYNDSAAAVKHLEKIYVLGNSGDSASTPTLYGYLPGIYRGRGGKHYAAFVDTDNYLIINSGINSYNSSKSSIYIDKSGNWYG